jgi:hypothetical protein
MTQILISKTYRFECISRLIKVTYNNDARRKLEIDFEALVDIMYHTYFGEVKTQVLKTY